MSSSCAKNMLPPSATMGGSRRNRKNRKGGSRRNRKTEGGNRKTEGGKRKSRRAPSDWNKLVMKVFRELKASDKSASFSDALREASKRKKQGKL